MQLNYVNIGNKAYLCINVKFEWFNRFLKKPVKPPIGNKGITVLH